MDEDRKTIFVGNLSEKVGEDILYELFMQGGPIEKVSIPKDRDGKQKSFGFVTFKHECSVPYALDLFNGTTLFNRTLNMKSRNNVLEQQQYQHQYQAQPMYNQHQSKQLYQFNPPPETETNNLNLNMMPDINRIQMQVLSGMMQSPQLGNSNMFNMMPLGSNMYPSQSSQYSQNSSNSRHDSRHHSRSHLYPRERENPYYKPKDRHNNHEDLGNSRDNYKGGSHRLNRKESRRNYR